ncbi:MAG: alpha/beta hydrolase family protein, partial [Lachnospiraceae bacterium]
LSEVPDTFGQWGNWITLGRIYVEDIWDLDPYETIGDYDRPVLLLHGDADGLVDSSWSERARDTYSHAEFHLIENGSHGFYGQPFAEAVGDIEDFLARHMPAA